LVATPGRLLQHLDQTALLNVARIQLLGKIKIKKIKKLKNKK